MALSTPTAEQAESFSRTVGDDEAFLATILSPSAGGRPQYLFSLAMMEQFLEVRTIQDFEAVGLRLDVHYVDFGSVAQWLTEVIGDTELAGEVLRLVDQTPVFGDLVPTVKALIAERLEQCDAVLETAA